MESDDPDILRAEILSMLEKVDDRGSLLFFQWLLRRIYANFPIPGDEELRAMHRAFIRMHAAFKADRKPTDDDMEILSKWTDGDAQSIGRALGKAVKFFREKIGMSRLDLAKKTRLALRTILGIERGRVFDVSPVMPDLTDALGVTGVELTDKPLDYEKGDDRG
jgi:ribosome-binding protein aMBF1 (putative translation factor)